MAGGGQTDYGDIFDLEALGRVVPTISTKTFIDRERARLGVPEPFVSMNEVVCGSPERRAVLAGWKSWLFDHAHVVPWNPLTTLICVPDIFEVATSGILTEALIDRRELTEPSPEMTNAPVIHFPCKRGTPRYRQLGQVATMLACSDPELARATRRLLKAHVRYVPQTFELATAAVDRLTRNGGEYAAVHARRNDFQFKKARTNAEVTSSNLRGLLRESEPLYVATDEVDELFFEALAAHRPIYRWRDAMPTRDDASAPSVPHALVGPIEQLICATARMFVGTRFSTFSSYIHRLRGYLGAPDTNEYLHTVSYDAPAPPGTELPRRRGQEYLRECPSLWLDA